MILALNLQLKMDLAKLLHNQLQLYNAHQEFVMKPQIPSQLTLNVKLIILLVLLMEEDVNHLFLVVIIKIKQLVQPITHAYGLHLAE